MIKLFALNAKVATHMYMNQKAVSANSSPFFPPHPPFSSDQPPSPPHPHPITPHSLTPSPHHSLTPSHPHTLNSHPVSSNGQWPTRVEVFAAIVDGILVGKVLRVGPDQSFNDFPVHAARALVRNDRHVVVIDNAVGDLDLQGGGRGEGEREGGRE